MLIPQFRDAILHDVSIVQSKMADRIVEIINNKENGKLFIGNNSITTEALLSVLKKLYTRYIDEIDDLIISYDHPESPQQTLVDMAHAIERLNKGYINFTADTTADKLMYMVHEYNQQQQQQNEEPETEVIEPEVVETP